MIDDDDLYIIFDKSDPPESSSLSSEEGPAIGLG
jgi:hypothetical protein